jgi:hypothetical protein
LQGERAGAVLLLNGTGWIMNRLATIKEQKQKAREERFAAVQERLAMLLFLSIKY